jgi:TrwC relaxase
VRREHNGVDRYQATGGLVAVAFEHRMSRAGDPQYHTHVLVQNAAQGPDGRWTALDSDRLYAHLMAADHLYLAAERAALTERLGVRWGPVDDRSGAAEIQGLDDRTLIERFSKRSEEIDQWLTDHGLSGIKASSAAAVATRAPKDHSESEQDVYQRWGTELAEQGVGERQLAEVCSGGRGRPVTRTEVDAVLDWLAGPDGLTGQASTFTRPDVVDALAKRLPVAPSAHQAVSQAEDAAERFLAERAVRVGHDGRLGMERYSTPELLTLESLLPKGGMGRSPVAWRTSSPRRDAALVVGADDRAVPACSSVGRRGPGGLVPPQLEQVVGAAQQLPLRGAGAQPATQEPSGAADVLDLAEDRLDGLLSLGVAGLAVAALELGGHCRAQPVAAGLRGLAVLAGLALAAVAGRRDQQLRRVRQCGQVGDRPVAGVGQQRPGPLGDPGGGKRGGGGGQHRVELLQVVGLLGQLGRDDDLLAGGDRLGVVALQAALAGVHQAAVGVGDVGNPLGGWAPRPAPGA